MLVSFDGPNGAGKTTIINEINKELCKKHKTFITKEPTNDMLGKCVKENNFSLRGMPYLFLIAANRAEHYEKELQFHTKDIILCDRYIVSNLALQHAENVPLEIIWDINKYFPQPDISFIISASAETLNNRIGKRAVKTHFEKILTRQEEINLYRAAFEFELYKRQNIYWIENNDGTLIENIETIIKTILDTQRED